MENNVQFLKENVSNSDKYCWNINFWVKNLNFSQNSTFFQFFHHFFHFSPKPYRVHRWIYPKTLLCGLQQKTGSGNGAMFCPWMHIFDACGRYWRQFTLNRTHSTTSVGFPTLCRWIILYNITFNGAKRPICGGVAFYKDIKTNPMT